MTYCIAWKSKRTVYLISDSARTIENGSGSNKLQKNYTSVGEKSVHSGNITVEEWLHKQFRVDDKFIITYAGDVHLAIGIVKNIRRCFNHVQPLAAFERAIDSVRNPERPTDVQFLFGIREDDEIRLYAYNLNDDKKIVEIEEDKLVQIGSLSDSIYSEKANKMYNAHIRHLNKPIEQFYQFLTFIQSFGIRNYTLEDGAGGLYSGLYLDANGVHWVDDTSLIIYDRNMNNPSEVNIFLELIILFVMIA